MTQEAMIEDEVLTCQRHPKVETTLRCYQCGAPICHNCAQRTPVGYQCPDCRRGLKRRFEQARPLDYGIAAIVSLVLGTIAGIFLPIAGWFTVFLSPVAGTLIAEITWRLVNRHYSSHLWWIVAAGIIIGTLPHIAIRVFGLFLTPVEGQIFSWIGMLWPLVHIGLAVGASSARLKIGG